MVPPLVVLCSLVILFISTHARSSITVSAAEIPVKESFLVQTDPLSESFPPSIQKWKPLIEEAAFHFDLDSNFIAAVMLQESGGNESAYSSSGAIGLMQVMPRDGIAASFICEGRPCFANRPTIEELEIPDFNIHYGSQLLKGLIDQFNSYREALKAYGPMDSGYDYADIVLSIYDQHKK